MLGDCVSGFIRVGGKVDECVMNEIEDWESHWLGESLDGLLNALMND
jgi:hypothetical protein